jgi:hypothetical protein
LPKEVQVVDGLVIIYATLAAIGIVLWLVMIPHDRKKRREAEKKREEEAEYLAWKMKRGMK